MKKTGSNRRRSIVPHYRWLLVLWLLLPLPLQAELPGDYQVIVPYHAPPGRSLDRVTIHEVFSFDCPHCYTFHKHTKKALQEKFGDKLQVIPQPIGWRGHDPGRLYFIAEKFGKGDAVILMIFDFLFDKGLGAEMFKRDKLQFVARLNGLSDEFKTMMDDPEIVAAMNRSVAFAKKRRIESTPTLVVEGVLIPTRQFDNLVTIINALLKEPVN
jgi:predicted DsbA family dithiol-disulfide isomerase